MKNSILHINSNYAYTRLHQCMLEKLDTKNDIENRVFVPVYDKAAAVVKTDDKVLVCECFKKWDRLFFDHKQSKICKALEAHHTVKEFALIHAHTLFTDGNCARQMSKKHGVPYVVAIRNTDVNLFFRLMPHLRRRGIRIMRDAAAIFFLSDSYKQQVFDQYVPLKYRVELEAKTHIIPNGIDDFWLDNQPDRPQKIADTIKLIYAGRIDRNKNIPTTQKAMQILRERGYDVSLTVVGKVEDKKIYKAIKRDPYTQCLPAQPKESLLELYRAHNIFVMPSFTESFGLVYAEAMSQGLPVIYSKGQGFDNQFPEGNVGYHVSANDAEDVADGIEKVIKNNSNIIPNTVSSAKIFNWTEITSRYDRIYKTILGESGV